MKNIINILLVNILFISSIYAFEKDIIESGTDMICKIVGVDDGDTFDISCKDKEDKQIYVNNVRLFGVNTPDIGKDGYKHCYYDEAKEIVKKLQDSNRDFEVNFYGSDLCKDPYKGCRNLVTLKDIETKTDINNALILKGYALKWIDFSNIPKEIRIDYSIAEIKAKKDKKGLWGKCDILYNDDSQTDTAIPPTMTK
ncbi:MAG: thermonuclease family protein [Candidatus Gracilibacteria bacterium]|nr:thermonuclease family protein [Candidatus Gracilibacteria bacterium]